MRAKRVELVLNLATSHVSPQHHIACDDEFSTVPHLTHNKPPRNWEKLFNYHTEHLDAEDSSHAQLRDEFIQSGLEFSTTEI